MDSGKPLGTPDVAASTSRLESTWGQRTEILGNTAESDDLTGSPTALLSGVFASVWFRFLLSAVEFAPELPPNSPETSENPASQAEP